VRDPEGLDGSQGTWDCPLPLTSHQLCHQPSGSKTNQTLCSHLARTCQTGCYDAFCRPSPLYVQPGQQSGKPFHPGERQKLILFQLRHRVSHYIDLQFTAVRRHSQQEASWTGNIITTSWGSANSISGQKVLSRYTPVGPHPVARIAKLTACVPFFPEFESVCAHRSFVLRTRRENAQQGRR
jgi:hypothetical protein